MQNIEFSLFRKGANNKEKLEFTFEFRKRIKTLTNNQ